MEGDDSPSERGPEEKSMGDREELFLAAVDDDLHVALQVLTRDESVSFSTDSEGRSAIHIAAQYGSVTVLKALLKRGSSVDATDGENATPLFWAAREGRDAAVRTLLAKSANLELVNSRGQTCLHAAIMWGHASTVETILRHQDSSKIIDVRDASGSTALHWAIRRDQSELVKLLLLNGANAKQRDAMGNDAATLAQKKGKREIAEILLTRAGKSEEEIRMMFEEEAAGLRPRHSMSAASPPARRTRAGTMMNGTLTSPWSKWEQLEHDLEEERRKRVEAQDKLRRVEDEKAILQTQLVRAQEQCRQAEQQFANERLQKKNEWSFYERKFLELQHGITSSFKKLPAAAGASQSERATAATGLTAPSTPMPSPLPPRPTPPPTSASASSAGSIPSDEDDLREYVQDLHRVIEAFQDLLQANSRSKNDEARAAGGPGRGRLTGRQITRLERQVQELQRQLASALELFKEPAFGPSGPIDALPALSAPPTPRSPEPAAAPAPGPLPTRVPAPATMTVPITMGPPPARNGAPTPRSLFSSNPVAPASPPTPRTAKRLALPATFDLVGCFRGISPRADAAGERERPFLRGWAASPAVE